MKYLIIVALILTACAVTPVTKQPARKLKKGMLVTNGPCSGAIFDVGLESAALIDGQCNGEQFLVMDIMLVDLKEVL